MTVAASARPASLRERQRRFALAEIERTALDLFARRGFDEVSVDEIVAAVGTSQRTFFRYFASKDEVLLGYERRIHERFMAALRARPADEGPVTALRQAYVTTSTVAAADLPEVVLRARVVSEAPVLRARAHGERRQKIDEIAGELAPRIGIGLAFEEREAKARLIAASMTAVAQAEWDAWLVDGGRRNPAELIGRALDELIDGLDRLDEARGCDGTAAAGTTGGDA